MVYPRKTNKELRPYQEKIVACIGNENTIVKMPTGSGKTFVAAEFILRGIEKAKQTPTNTTKQGAALFLAPTCDLVTQQKRALEEWFEDYVIADYFGSKAIPTARFDVLVSTPQAFLVCVLKCFISLVHLAKLRSLQFPYLYPDTAANKHKSRTVLVVKFLLLCL